MRNNPAQSSFRQFQLSIAVIVVIVLLGAAGFYWVELSNSPHAEGLAYIDALWWAIETVTTIGYGDFVPKTYYGKVYGITFIIIAVVTLAWAGASAVAFMVEGHLSQSLRMRKIMKQIDSLKDHYILCGLGRVGLEVLRNFRQYSMRYVVIDKSQEMIDSIINDDELFLVGDATQDEILLKANIKHARGLIACFPSDADNVFTVLTAKGINPELFVIARGSSESTHDKLIRAGANRVVLPSHLGGGRMAAMALRPTVVEFLDQSMHAFEGEEPLLLEEIPVREGSRLDGVMLKDTHIKSISGVTIMGVKDTSGHIRINPPSDYPLHSGVTLVGLGFHSQFEALRRMMGCENENE
ncbi:MAG: hypothetical protein GC154_16345 [bacterium]|nr:hypothetical protein [bacterium]